MSRARLLHSLALLVFAALFPALSFALNQTYEGVLRPAGGASPVPIVVELRDAGGQLTGSVQTEDPIQAKTRIQSAVNVYGRCTVTAKLSKPLTLHLDGPCGQSEFAGNFRIFDSETGTVTRGDFQLERKASASAKADSSGRTVTAGGATAACLKANTQCLAACPRGAAGPEFLCSNHCRTKLRTCKGLVKKPDIELD